MRSKTDNLPGLQEVIGNAVYVGNETDLQAIRNSKFVGGSDTHHDANALFLEHGQARQHVGSFGGQLSGAIGEDDGARLDTVGGDGAEKMAQKLFAEFGISLANAV